MHRHVRPPDNIEYFLTEIYRSTRENGGRPDDFEAAYLMHRYRTEFDTLDIPGFVKTVVFPVLRNIGGLTGKFARFRDAPPSLEPRPSANLGPQPRTAGR